jgi:predicted aspartyl protease
MLPFVSVAERRDSINTIRFSSPHRSMIVVGVRVDGKGPYRFLLDTGATSSIVDPQLSSSLNLSAAQSVRLASWQDTTDARRVFVQSISLGPIDSGPLSVLVQPLSEFKAFDPQLRGVLGQDVLLRSNFLIDNSHHRIQFDGDGALLSELTGDHVSIAPVRTRAGALEPRLIAVPVQIASNTEPLHLLLDSGADMVVLQPSLAPATTRPRGSKWIADQNGKSSAATTFHTRLSVGSQTFGAEAWIGDAGLKFLAIDGLLPTGSFDRIYIANRGSFVIIEPGRTKHSRMKL